MLPENDAARPKASTTVSWRYSMCTAAAVIAARASGADAPAAIRSSSASPSAGSVTFWEQAAPTRARALAQRAATAGLDDMTIAPSMPVRAQQPDQREGHGRTAVTVTSTTHSGRASACTTRPVKTGYTPARRSPSTW